MSDSTVDRLFRKVKEAAELGHIHLHDLRGTFAMHRAMVVKSFRQLQAELGHGDPRSIQSYLDRAQQFDPRESIFYSPQPHPCQPANPSFPASPPAYRLPPATTPTLPRPVLH